MADNEEHVPYAQRIPLSVRLHPKVFALLERMKDLELSSRTGMLETAIKEAARKRKLMPETANSADSNAG